jgi:hypothetical protein
MRKLLLIIALLLAPSLAQAQCNGVFPPNTVCGSLTTAPPSAVPFTSFSGGGGGGGTVTGAAGGQATWYAVTGSTVSGNSNFYLPVTPSVAGQVPTSAGAGTPMTWSAGVRSVGTFTLTANATTTTVTVANCSTSSFVVLSPQTQDAANDMATTSIVPGTGQFVVTHANNSRVDRTFGYIVVGG